MHHSLSIVLAGVLVLANGSAGAQGTAPFRDADVPQPAGLQAQLDARSFATVGRESTWDPDVSETRSTAGASVAKSLQKQGYLGEREGDLDPSIRVIPQEPGVANYFIGYGGRGAEARAFALSQREDGSLILAGQVGAPDSGGLPTRIAIVQLRPNGARDTAVGTGGVQTFDIPNSRLEVVDGFGLTETLYGAFFDRVYLLARDFETATSQRFALMCFRRLSAETGFEFCPDFGAAGVRYYAFGLASGCASDNSLPSGLHLDRSSSFNNVRIYMVGSVQRTFNSCGDHDFGIVRVGLSGNPDTSFSGDGYATVFTGHRIDPPGAIVAAARAVAVRADGRIVVGGSTTRAGQQDALMVQLLANGALDGNFCLSTNSSCDSVAPYTGGRRGFSTFTSGEVTAFADAAGSDHVFVARTTAVAGGPGSGRLRRIDGAGGCSSGCSEVNMLPGTGARFVPASVLWQPSNADGVARLTVGGTGTALDSPDNRQAYVYRYRFTESGLSNDTAWVTGGVVSWRQDISWPNVGSTPQVRDATVSQIVLDRQSRVLVAGGARTFGTERDMVLARLQGDMRLFRDSFE